MIRCPKTGRSISTEIETEVSDFERLPYVEAELHCPHCGQNHTWTRREAWLQETWLQETWPADATPPLSGIKIGEAVSE
jgi:hypothetical protein